MKADKQRPEYQPNRISDPNYVRIFDTTLRDGEQSPGASLTSKQKLGIAKQLSKLGVDVIEAGFPVASPDDFEAVRLIAQEVGNDVQQDGYVPVICGMARTLTKDLDRYVSRQTHGSSFGPATAADRTFMAWFRISKTDGSSRLTTHQACQ